MDKRTSHTRCVCVMEGKGEDHDAHHEYFLYVTNFTRLHMGSRIGLLAAFLEGKQGKDLVSWSLSFVSCAGLHIAEEL
jgi:hypothetical protein